MNSQKISAAVVSYNTRDQLSACLTALAKDGWSEVMVVDNASHDGSAEMVGQDFPWVQLVANTQNRGYGSAANQAIARTSSDYLFLLNADTTVADGAAVALSRYLDDHPEVAVLGPRLVNPDGSLQPSCYPFLTPGNVLSVMTGLNQIIGRIGLATRHLPTSNHQYARRVPWVKGAALALRTKALRSVGGFDESFFLYGEEHDLCYRLSKARWQTHFAPVTTVVHLERASSPGLDAAVTEQVYSSLVHFYRCHYSRRRLLELRAVLAGLMTLRIVRDVARLARARESVRRQELRADIGVWGRVLLGRQLKPSIAG